MNDKVKQDLHQGHVDIRKSRKICNVIDSWKVCHVHVVRLRQDFVQAVQDVYRILGVYKCNP